MNKQKEAEYEPKLFNLETEAGRAAWGRFREDNPSMRRVDTLGEQKYELALVRKPSLVSHESLNGNLSLPVSPDEGVWSYFSWTNTAVRILPKEDYEELRLSRNRNLITRDEQNQLASSIVGVAGLNVGNPGAVCIALEGISGKLKLADFDALSVSNLNRFRAGLSDIGINKTHISARQIYEVNPYADVNLYTKGIKEDNIMDFLNKPKVDILIEEMDNLKLKIAIREKARACGIPVIMATGNGEDVLIDVERYDLDKNLPLLNGYLEKEVMERVGGIKPGEGSYRERIDLARDFMGVSYLAPRLLLSFQEVGTSLAGIPQLAESAFLRGAVIAHFAKKILLRESIASGRYAISLSGKMLKPI